MAEPGRGSSWQALVGCTLAIGVAFHLLAQGDGFLRILGWFLTLIMIIGGMLVMVGQKTPAEVLGAVVIGGIALLVLPPLMSDAVLHLWHSMTWLTIALLITGILVLAVLVAGGKR